MFIGALIVGPTLSVSAFDFIGVTLLKPLFIFAAITVFGGVFFLAR
jgi:hypothetical protein